jgi:uncharacterized protein with WD repeat
MIEYSPSGDYIVTVYKEKLQIFSTISDKTHDKLFEINEKGIDRIQFSPLGTYLVTIRDFDEKTDEVEGEGNLVVWKLEDGKPILKIQSKTISDKW